MKYVLAAALAVLALPAVACPPTVAPPPNPVVVQNAPASGCGCQAAPAATVYQAPAAVLAAPAVYGYAAPARVIVQQSPVIVRQTPVVVRQAPPVIVKQVTKTVTRQQRRGLLGRLGGR